MRHRRALGCCAAGSRAACHPARACDSVLTSCSQTAYVLVNRYIWLIYDHLVLQHRHHPYPLRAARAAVAVARGQHFDERDAGLAGVCVVRALLEGRHRCRSVIGCVCKGLDITFGFPAGAPAVTGHLCRRRASWQARRWRRRRPRWARRCSSAAIAASPTDFRTRSPC